jgi:hypothetical protein
MSSIAPSDAPSRTRVKSGQSTRIASFFDREALASAYKRSGDLSSREEDS